MQKKLAAILAGAGLSASLLALTGPAQAGTSGTWTVTPGGNISVGLRPLTKLIIKGVWGMYVCPFVSGSGTAASGSGLPGSHILTINSLATSNCTGPGNMALTISMNGMPFYMNAVSYDAATGVTTSDVSGVRFTYANPVDGCVATITGPGGAGGTVDAAYANSTHWLHIGGGSSLVVNAVNSSCSPSQIQVGDPITLTATLVIPDQTITSP
ncbi:hypothetical protein [Actinomadura verrucosospora]|uniref:Secreted protein n=1 Tax=Actinomadura verrucosospora TaxID=46165 RepID=A0A7D3W1T5_ACTVE|nr:hypothetical protein [Actinomadura verrucosospora]QKG27098.1 hypothetical protein ACTIVE_8751 [Actinomadura verrucosospora]